MQYIKNIKKFKHRSFNHINRLATNRPHNNERGVEQHCSTPTVSED